MSLNCQNLNAKIDHLNIMVTNLKTSKLSYSAICLQETWLSDISDTFLLQIDGHSLISVGRICSAHGGLLIYLRDIYSYEILNLYTVSNIWDGQFIEVSGASLVKKIIIGNIYRPPRNLIDNYANFIAELTPILHYLSRSKSEAVIAGDFNTDLLKLNENDNFNDFFDTMTAHTFYPKITLPTRFTDRTCTLIDNFFCKFSDASTECITGNLTNHIISDHQPYFIRFDNMISRKKVSNFIHVDVITYQISKGISLKPTYMIN